MRGKDRFDFLVILKPGITPACAGKSFDSVFDSGFSKDHPRVCGEKGSAARQLFSTQGSPPRVRGKECPFPPAGPQPGITPACAGKSAGRHQFNCSNEDHPRVCGEKNPAHTLGNPPTGSPPRVRGKDVHKKKSYSRMRITPACAGKSTRLAQIQKPAEDHPRVCGEKYPTPHWRFVSPGSPPRVRGKERDDFGAVGPAGITPACAGKRAPSAEHAASQRDHPRVCGEKPVEHSPPAAPSGSPPRVRGKVDNRLKICYNLGITPACAGKRLKKAHKIKDFDPVPIRFHLVFRRFERWCSNLPTPDGNVPV